MSAIRTFLWRHAQDSKSLDRTVWIWEMKEDGPRPIVMDYLFRYQDPLRKVKEILASHGVLAPPVNKPSGASVFEPNPNVRIFEL
jgi:hypothetical protein